MMLCRKCSKKPIHSYETHLCYECDPAFSLEASPELPPLDLSSLDLLQEPERKLSRGELENIMRYEEQKRREKEWRDLDR